MVDDEPVLMGHLLGVRVTRSATAWLNPLLLLGASLLLARLWPARDRRDWLANLIGFVLAGGLTNATHALGHITSSRLVGGPMDELLITGLRFVTLYHDDQRSIPSQVHLGRAVGGTLANLALALLVAPLASGPAPTATRRLARQLMVVNLVFGLASWAPLPGVDGEIIWREARRSRIEG